jgi:hypothetical protein
LSAEYNMDYAMQQSGGLTDAQFAMQDNLSWKKLVGYAMVSIELWYQNQWAFTFKHQSFGLEKEIVFFVKTLIMQMLLVLQTNDYENRRVDRDFTKIMVLKTEIFINIK